MKITIEKKELQEAVELAARCAKRDGGSRLSAVVLSAADDELRVFATDLGTAVEVILPAEVEVEGRVGIYPGNGILAALKTLPEGTDEEPALVTLDSETPEGEGEQLLLRGEGRAWWEFMTLAEDEVEMMPVFPEPDGEGVCRVSMGAISLVRLARQTTYAVAHEKGRYALNGVQVRFMNDALALSMLGEEVDDDAGEVLRVVFTAADGARLALAVSPPLPAKDSDGLFEVWHRGDSVTQIVPAEVFGVMVSGLSRGKNEWLGDVDLAINNDSGTFWMCADDVRVSTQCIEGMYPNVVDVLPSGECTTEVRMHPDDLKLALRQAVVTASDRQSNAIEWTLGEGEQGATAELFSQSVGVGQSYAQVPGYHRGERVNVIFNHQYVWDIARAADGEEVSMQLRGGDQPVRIVPGKRVVCVVSPVVRTDDGDDS